MADEMRTLGADGAPSVIDEAYVGEIRGALGTIGEHDLAPRRSLRARLLTLAAIVGPGLIVMVGDNDAGGVATYSQAGQNYGTTLLWTLLLLIPVLIVNQEMVVRLGAVTGVGHARLIVERFGRFWGAFSVGDLEAACAPWRCVTSCRRSALGSSSCPRSRHTTEEWRPVGAGLAAAAKDPGAPLLVRALALPSVGSGEPATLGHPLSRSDLV